MIVLVYLICLIFLTSPMSALTLSTTPSSKLLPCHMLTQTPRVNLASITRSTRLLWALNETNCLIDNKYFMIYDDDCQIPCSRLMLIDKLQQWSELDFCDRIIGAWSSQLDLYNTCYRKQHLVKDISNRFLIDWEANTMSFFIAGVCQSSLQLLDN